VLTKKLLPNELLQMYRSRTKLTQADMAGLLGLKSFRMIQYWEGGYSLPKSEKLKRMVEVFIENKVFVADKELEEARQLWNTVKNASDARLDSQTPYPVFDEYWLATLLKNDPKAKTPEPAKPAKPAKTPSKLPTRLTGFVGREREMSIIFNRLTQPQTRLLTLTGAGGTGKTRLSIEIAHKLLPEFEHGCFFVALNNIQDPSLVPSAIAQTLGIHESDTLLERIKIFLAEREVLLVLDNFEHLMSAAPLVTELLASAPQLKILVSSREILRLYGENQFEVSPLTQLEALNLFVQRAQAVKPNFELTEENKATINEICRRLDGLPLAIELAAARIKLFTPTALLGRLADRLNLLVGGAQDLPTHQQTLKAAIEWSYRLLSSDEQKLFCQFAVFTGGSLLEGIEAICDNADGKLLDRVAGLVDKSILIQQSGANDEPRFMMLETLREYGLYNLTQAGELDEMRWKHVEYYAQVAERAYALMSSKEQVKWLNRLEEDHPNIRAAIEYLQGVRAENASRDPQAVGLLRLRIASHLWRFWWIKGHLSEGRAQLHAVMQHADEVGLNNHITYSVSLGGAASLAYFQGENEVARPLYERALELKHRLGDMFGYSTTLNGLGLVARTEGDYDSARKIHDESLKLKQEMGDKIGSATSLNNLGIVAFLQGDYEEAKTLHEQSLALRREFGDRQGIIHSLNNLGEVYREENNFEQAVKLYTESLTFSQQLGDKQETAHSYNGLAMTAYAQGDFAKARDLNTQSMLLREELDDKRGIAECLITFALLACADPNETANRAARLLGAVARILEGKGRFASADKLEFERSVEQVRQQLDDTSFNRAFREGKTSELRAIVAYAAS
jgi:predicted ATPase/Tfp pilus assembly protein PilF/transcriptional regulator with XRE-family HTH domain